MMNPYELVYILHPDLEADLEAATTRVQALVTDLEGRVLSEDVWGKRRLAYPIDKLGFGVYVVVKLELPGEAVAGLERELGLMDEVIRHLLVSPPKPRAKTTKPAKKRARPKSTEPEKSESERMADLDQKLEEIIGPSGPDAAK